MKVEQLLVDATRADLKFDFPQPNGTRLDNLDVKMKAGTLMLRHLLNGNPRRVNLLLEGTPCDFELLGTPAACEAEIEVRGDPGSIQLTIQRSVGLFIEGPAPTLKHFATEHLVARGPSLVSRDYESATCRVHLRFLAPPASCSVEWEGVSP